MKPVYLRCVDVNENHYKFYKMIPIDSNTFRVEFGREGAKPQVKEYPMSKWNSLYASKVKKGYVDKSEHFALEKEQGSVDVTRAKDSDSIYAEIPDEEVRKLVEQLIGMSRKVVSENYNISSKYVTQQMIDDAQCLIDLMVKTVQSLKTYEGVQAGVVHRHYCMFNDYLLKLLNVVPRKIAKVSNALLLPSAQRDYDLFISAATSVIKFEEGLLDNMRTCVTSDIIQQEQQETGVQVDKKTLLDALGLSIERCDDDDWKRIKGAFEQRDKNNGLDKKVITAFKVINKKTDNKYTEWKSKYRDDYKRFPSKLLWHGSRNENWWAIINSGLMIRPSGAVYTGSMFGDGIYFANSALKSYGYTSSNSAYWVRGNAKVVFMALFEVGVGNQFHTDNNHGDICRMSWNKIRSMKDNDDKPYHSLYAHRGKYLRNDELVVYNRDQVTIRYLVMFRG